MQTIPIFFTFNRNFIVPAAVAFYSLLKNADKQYFYKMYVLHSDITEKQKKKLQKVLVSFKTYSSLVFVNVEKYHDSEWSTLNSKQHYSKEIYNKLILDLVFPQYDRIICSDVDVVFEGDISKSYFSFPNEMFYVSGIRGVVETAITDRYVKDFNERERKLIYHGVGAGYLLLNLQQIRQDGIGQKMRDFYKNNLHRLIQPEQDVINLCCYPNIRYLSLNYMVCTYLYFMNKECIRYFDDIENPEFILNEALRNPIQVHYAGYNKPWNSFFITKWTLWLHVLYDAGFVFEYLKKLPFYILQRRKKYSLHRFLNKAYKKLKWIK